eukprot:1702242-Rhodomonas_salina.1
MRGRGCGSDVRGGRQVWAASAALVAAYLSDPSTTQPSRPTFTLGLTSVNLSLSSPGPFTPAPTLQSVLHAQRCLGCGAALLQSKCAASALRCFSP